VTDRQQPGEMLDAELSLLAFQRRVLAIAQDPATPLIERMRFLGIVTSNIDELYMVRMAELRRAAIDESHDHIAGSPYATSPKARLAAVEHEVSAILAAQSICADECVRAAAHEGVQLVTWAALTDAERAELRRRYLEEIQPDLTPSAITLSPGHPLPHLPHLGLFVAIVFRASINERARLAEHELPRDVPRLMPVRGRAGAMIAIEEVMRANASLLYPNAIVEGAYLFRVTRGGDLPIQEDDSVDLLGAVALATERRPHNPAVRVEVERNMPPHIGALILDSLRREAVGRDMELTVDAVQVVDGLLDLRCLQDLPVAPVSRTGEALEYPPMVSRHPVPATASMFDVIRSGDLLAHHPFDAFDDTVVRFLQEAAADPDVTTIKATFYRVGNPSPVVEALLAAARSGKLVFVLVELKARFDEEHNVQWARALERAGGSVVYGLPGLKVHAKVTLVLRREHSESGEHTRAYVHVGTGNYNTRSGRQYTDLSLFSARDDLAHDVADLFVALAARSDPADGLAHGSLVAPAQLLPALLERIAREADHARAGRPAQICIKINGLADAQVVRALYDASSAGVDIELIVRGICTLRSGVPGRSERIRVSSVVGRWLEHSRVYRFENGGAPEYFIGSSDLRPRNLRRRVELLVPVLTPAHQQQLDALLTRYLNDPTAWVLQPDGSYLPRTAAGESAQMAYAREAAGQ
jgi:polyphosphate kinase